MASNFSSAQLQTLIDKVRGDPNPGQRLWVRLLQASEVNESTLVQALHEHQGIEVPDALEIESAQAQKLTGIGADSGLKLSLGARVLLVFEDPWSENALRALSRHAGADVRLAMTRADLASLAHEINAGRGAEEKPEPKAANKAVSGSVVSFVDQAIAWAYHEGASDIHFESTRKGIGVKYRLDGVMSIGPSLPDPSKAEEVISRIKVMGQLDITERRRPQDGRIRWQSPQGDGIDLRVSIMPSIFGEDAVLRLLDKAQLRHQSAAMSLDLLGFSAELAQRVRNLAAKPHGMLLVTGPTGSGKTTTVYAAMSEVNDGLEKIITIEDPVEYELPGVLQIPVNEQKGLTFATGLRSILRHDPDKILVGEIRDAETAQIAVQSALTGHLVFTTVHANSLFDVLGRFRHFNIEAFALASALNGIVVQRLLRQLCQHCHTWRTLDEEEVRSLEHERVPVPDKVPQAVGCSECRSTGYKGRFVLAEVHVLNDSMRDMMVSQESMSGLRAVIHGDGSQRLVQQAMTLVAQGKTTIEEVKRVVGLG
ncbi:MAG: GspE/PulE family protein [Hydrogenophaga sp.]|jgi:general secretion pathway protein E|nr:GspE/PulE family protein [Hydrogenophaga sp.]